MIEVTKIELTPEIEKCFNKKTGDIYKIEVDKQVVGYGLCDNCHENPVEVFITEKFRGNGYGTKLLKYLLETIKKTGILDTKFLISNGNYIAKRMIAKANGIQVSTYNDFAIFVLPIQKNLYLD